MLCLSRSLSLYFMFVQLAFCSYLNLEPLLPGGEWGCNVIFPICLLLGLYTFNGVSFLFRCSLPCELFVIFKVLFSYSNTGHNEVLNMWSWIYVACCRRSLSLLSWNHSEVSNRLKVGFIRKLIDIPMWFFYLNVTRCYIIAM